MARAKLLIDIPSMNWAYTVLLEPEKEYTFGTNKENSFPLPPGTASDKHARMVYKDGWSVSDIGSEKGIVVNGQTVTDSPLKHLDVVRIGSCEAVFQNPEEKAGKAERDHTHQVAEAQTTALKDVVQRAEKGDLNSADLESAVHGNAIGAGLAPQGFAPSMNAPIVRGREAPSMGSTDMVWVAQKLATIMSAVLMAPVGREEAYNIMLNHLRDAINADNGFVMIPNQVNSRWHVRAWVGDSKEWTQYEKSHPLPLTVTNRAFRTMNVVSNALASSADEPINSFSLQQLNVSSYIAVPLVQNQERRGVLYFDTRKQNKKFGPRDVKLLELAGSCILQIEGLT